MINLVIPMAGKGSRFLDAGYKTPKPLIDVKGLPMFAWAAKSFLPIYEEHGSECRFIYVAHDVQDEEYGIKSEIIKVQRELFPEAEVEIILVPPGDRGQAESVAHAREFIKEGRLVIFNADTYSPSTELAAQIDDETIDGSLVCFDSKDPRMSFAKVEKGVVTQTTEKDPISNHASNGMYYFRDGKDFLDATDEAMSKDERTGNEFYVAPLYNKLIAKGKKIVIAACDSNWVMGTPEQLNDFLERYDA